MPSAQAGVIVENDYATVTLMSYSTPVVTIDADGWMHVNGLYSTTTRRHISAFLREIGGKVDYSNAKFCVEKSMDYNINTGEVRPC